MSPGVANPALEAQLEPLRELEATYRVFSMAERVLVQNIGVPICISCGKCCMESSVMLWDQEARFLASWLLGQGPAYADRILSMCDGWLLDREAQVPTYGMKSAGTLTTDQWNLLGPQVDYILEHTPCPVFDRTDKRCMIHGAKPLTCRAYGVTRWAAPYCPRPISRIAGEDTMARAHIGENTQLGLKLKEMVGKVMGRGGGCRFLPVALYSILRPDKLNKYIADNLIASAKLVSLAQNPSILFQQELNEAWRNDIARAASIQEGP